MTTPKQKDPPENPSSHQELAEQALRLHNMTGGALIEVSDGTRRIKIGAWLPENLRNALTEILPAVVHSVVGSNKPPQSDRTDN